MVSLEAVDAMEAADADEAVLCTDFLASASSRLFLALLLITRPLPPLMGPLPLVVNEVVLDEVVSGPTSAATSTASGQEARKASREVSLVTCKNMYI